MVCVTKQPKVPIMTKNPVRVYPRKKIKAILRQLGLRRGPDDGTGHEVWIDHRGRGCRPVFRHNDVPYSYLFTLGQQLEGNGICLRRDFLALVKGEAVTIRAA